MTFDGMKRSVSVKRLLHILREIRWDIAWGIFAALLICGAFFFGSFLRRSEAQFWRSMFFVPEPELCSLCGYGEALPYHAPCLVNLTTGEVGELRVYEPNHYRAGELAEEQQTGYMTICYCAGIHGIIDASAHTCFASIPDTSQQMAPAYFCRDCRALLAEVSCEGYILLDLYDRDNVRTYPIVISACYTIRDYTVEIRGGEKKGHCEIKVYGNLFK